MRFAIDDFFVHFSHDHFFTVAAPPDYAILERMKTNFFYPLALGLFLPLCVTAVPADGSLLPNAGFEEGQPAGWTSGDSGAVWADAGFESRHSLAVKGSGSNTLSWRSGPLKLEPGGIYRLRYQGRSDAGTSGGCAVSGLSRVNRDFHFDESWRPYGFVFTVPEDGASDCVRLGQWEVNGTLYFDNARLVRAQAVHSRYGWRHLGEAESVRQGVYRFQPDYAWAGANYHRTLAANRCGFNSDRWTFQSGSELVYRHDLSNVVLKSARIALNLNYYTAGKLRVEASTNGVAWVSAATFDQGRRAGTNDLPVSLFPATHVLVRLIAEGDGANFQLNRYDFEAPLAQSMPDGEGKTTFFEIGTQTDALAVTSLGMRSISEAMSPVIVLSYLSKTNASIKISPSIRVDGREWISQPALDIFPDKAMSQCISTPGDVPGQHRLEIRVAGSDGTVLFAGETEFEIGLLAEPRAGYWAGGSGSGCQPRAPVESVGWVTFT
jgi:hypothetical protein